MKGDQSHKPTASELKRSKERQLDGGPDFDTTHLDRPSDLDRPGGDTIGEFEEHGPLTIVPVEKNLPGPMDPRGDDPFVPGTAEAPDNFDADALRSREIHSRASSKKRKQAPTYEANQGNLKEDHGGSVDPNDDLTEDTSGPRKE